MTEELLNGFNNGRDASDGVGGQPAFNAPEYLTGPKKKYDWLIVGAGLAGSVFAHEMTKLGKKCLILDRRLHIAGNCYTEKRNEIPIHLYGAHIFHTNSKEVWDWVNQFAKFKKYHHTVKCRIGDMLFTFPINLKTLNELGIAKNINRGSDKIITPSDASSYFKSWSNPETIEYKSLEAAYDLNKDNLETHCLKQIGPLLYKLFIQEYTKKQWGVDPKELPSRIIKRIPVRTNLDDTYFHNAEYEGIPENGYTEIFENCLKGIEIKLGVNYLDDMSSWDSRAENVLYTGPLDEYFNWDQGELEWRSLEFKHEHLEKEDFQGMSVVNYTQEKIPFTRILEHKHFIGANTPTTWITREFPKKWKKGDEPFYPIADDKNNLLWKNYKDRFESTGKHCIGRLADYKYYDMDQVIASSLALFKKLNKDKNDCN